MIIKDTNTMKYCYRYNYLERNRQSRDHIDNAGKTYREQDMQHSKNNSSLNNFHNSRTGHLEAI